MTSTNDHRRAAHRLFALYIDNALDDSPWEITASISADVMLALCIASHDHSCTINFRDDLITNDTDALDDAAFALDNESPNCVRAILTAIATLLNPPPPIP